MGTVANIKIEPMEVYLGVDAAHVQTVTCVADVSSSLNNKYFVLHAPSAVKHYYWFNVASGGSDPGTGLTGYTGHAVAISANASAATVATALELVIEATTGFDSTVSGAVITVTCSSNGYVAAGHDAQATASQTGFAFATVTVGDAFETVGYLDGDIEVSALSRGPVDITAHQDGATIIGQIMTSGGNPEMTFNLKEVTTANYRKILRYSNGEFYPVIANSTSGMGGGTKSVGGSPIAVRVVLHPVRLGIADKTNDYCFWNCTLDLDSISFSGENIITLPVKVKSFKDSTKRSEVNIWMYGDWSQGFANS